MLVERRRSVLTPELLVRVGLLWAVIAVLALLNSLHEISDRLYPDPDDIMRLVQVRDLLNGQGWFDLTQYRVDAASGGVVTHWSRLVDVPLAAVIFMLTPIFGANSAELAALVIVPLLTLFLAMLLTARIAWRLNGGTEASFACVAIGLSMPLLFQFGPMRIDHHGWQIVFALLAVNALMARTPGLGGWVAGFAIAAWLTISVEGAPLAAVLLGLVGLRWLRNRAERDWLVHCLRSLAVSSLALHLLTRGIPGAQTPCDAIGAAHLAAMAWAAIVTTVMARAEPIPRAGIMFSFAVAAVGGLAILGWGTAQCAATGPLGIDVFLRGFWHAQVLEGLPIWRQDLRTALQIVVLPLIGIFASLQLTARSHDWLRRWWADYTILLIASLILALLVARAGALACALAAAPLGWQINQWLRNTRNMKQPGKRAMAFAAMVCALLPALPLTVLAVAMPAKASIVGKPLGSNVFTASSCMIADHADTLASLPEGEIYAPLDIAPRLLLESPHSVIATGHHRGARGMREVIEIAIANNDTALTRLTRRGTRYVALCPELNEPQFYAAANSQGFMAQLLAGEAPDWLEPVALKGDGSFKLWRIRKPQSGEQST